MKTEQMDFWESQFGAEYTERNTFSTTELNEMYAKQYGVTRTAMNSDLLSNLEVKCTLEVGCNVGNQLNLLQEMGFENLYGLELQWYAVEKAKQLTKNINVFQGSGFDIPFRDNYFDLVYTSGVLIHIAPNDIPRIMDEVYRVSGKYIWGFEYFSETYEQISYRGNEERMWKGDYAQLYLDRFPDLKLIKTVKYPYTQNENIDYMFLLEKSK